ncbi:hypothetical protein MUK42_10159 [Musa troglodytarum]|uniref:Uncharacterized protein n=1 Tax=Musa troglodytarum TaxID=320322 RepID=A0A9E7G0H1_9LILI|nr:hypothetical protein MUK42_10159 [Musa troglodytarum]
MHHSRPLIGWKYSDRWNVLCCKVVAVKAELQRKDSNVFKWRPSRRRWCEA